jgi:hypothetical protein
MKYMAVLSLLLFASCGKDEDPTFCFECVEFTITTSPSGFYDEETVTTEECDKTDGDAASIENEGTFERNEGINTIIRTTTCNKQD